jgi:hypothetical protein
MSAALDLSEAAGRLKAEIFLPAVIGRTLPLKRSGRFLAAPCPFHAERTPSFYVYPDHYHCFGCGAHGDVFDWLDLTAGLTFPDALRLLSNPGGASSLPARRVPDRDPRVSADTRGAAERIWRQAADPKGTPVETYLRCRGVRLPDGPVIRWHPSCPRRDGGVLELVPAMVALMTNPVTAEPVGIHRTFLQPDGRGKAGGKAKMMLGTAGVVRLAPDDDIGEGLGIAEGIETALTCMQVIGWGPVWAACSRGGIEAFPVLPRHALTIFADGDQPGLAAARACAARWSKAGQEALIHAPPEGQDWNDAARGIAA